MSKKIWVKNSWKCWGFAIFSCWQLWFPEKIVKFCQNWWMDLRHPFSSAPLSQSAVPSHIWFLGTHICPTPQWKWCSGQYGQYNSSEKSGQSTTPSQICWLLPKLRISATQPGFDMHAPGPSASVFKTEHLIRSRNSPGKIFAQLFINSLQKSWQGKIMLSWKQTGCNNWQTNSYVNE